MNERVSNRVGMTQMYDIFMIYFCRRARPRLEKLQGVTGRLKTVVMFITNATSHRWRFRGRGRSERSGCSGCSGCSARIAGSKGRTDH